MIGILLGVAFLAGAAFGPASIAIASVAGLAGIQLGWLRPIPGLVLVLAALGGFLRVQGASVGLESPSWAGDYHAYYIDVLSSPASDGQFQRFIATAKPASRAVTGTATVCVSAPDLPKIGRGDNAYVVGDGKSTAQVSPSFASYLERNGCSLSLTAYDLTILDRGAGFASTLDRLRQRMSEAVQRAVPGDAGALISGLATGDDAALSDPVRAAFYATGTSHVTAVSGSNLALFIGFFAVAGAAAGWLRRFAWQLATVTAIWTYVVLIGMGAPAFRSALVATLAIVGLRLGRKPDMLTLGVLVAAIEVVIRPQDFYLLSFRLSTAASIGLLLALGTRYPTTLWGWIWKASASSAAANLATAPFLLASVGLPFPLRSILTNLLIAPIIDVLFPLSVALSILGAISVSLAQTVAPPIELLSRLCLWIVQAASRAPGGALQPGAIPLAAWSFALLVVSAFCMFSGECRGGAARLGRRLLLVAPAARLFAAAVVVGGAVGWSIALSMR